MRNFFILISFFFIFYESPRALEFSQLESKKGIKFWFLEDNTLPILSVSFCFKGGSYFDPIGKEGTANLMTSLLDEGTRDFSALKFKQEMKLNGMKLYFSAEKNQIEGSFQIISSQFEQGFKLFYEAINHPSFKQNQIENVKNQIRSSIKINDSDITRVASKKFNNNFYIDHNYRKNVKGSLESLEKIKKEDIIEFFKKYITRSNLVIGIAGNINEKAVKKFVDYVFGDLPISEEELSIPKFKGLSKGKKTFEMETPQTAVIVGQPGLERGHKDFFAARIINYVLGGGSFQSRLYSEIREKKGLVYSIYSYLLSYNMDGIILGGFQTRNQSVKEVINLIIAEWEKIKKKGISKNELEDAKTYYKGSFSRNFTSSMSIAKLLKIVQYYNLGSDYFIRRNII